MNYITSENGFSLSDGSVVFDFESDKTLSKNGGFYSAKFIGSAPVPNIHASDRLLLPVDEGIAIEADKTYPPCHVSLDRISSAFLNRNGTMSMIIVERDQKYLLIAIDDAFAAEYSVGKENGIYRLGLKCNEETDIIYAIFDSVKDACKFYRESRKEKFIPLTEKIKRNTEIERLVGGAVFWIWNDNYDDVMYSDKDTDVNPAVGDDIMRIADELYNSGVDKAMISMFFDDDSKYAEPLYKKYGYLSTQYDNYNDVFPPKLLKIVPNNRVKNCGYTNRRIKDFPDGIVMSEDGKMGRAWALKGFDGKMHNQYSLCPAVASKRMKEEISDIVRRYPYYKGRFIDVYGTGVYSCFSENHPITRRECLSVKRDAFASIAKMGLITGTEDGMEGLVNELDYSEGLSTPILFRTAESGRRHPHIYDAEETEHIKKNMFSTDTRVPLWELVHHEDMLMFPYWGVSTACCPEIIDRVTLYSVLFGTAPLYSFFVHNFEKLKDVILESYKKITAVNKKTALLPMTDFEYLTDDRRVQTTVFGDKYRIVANFSDSEFIYSGKTIAPSGFIMIEE